MPAPGAGTWLKRRAVGQNADGSLWNKTSMKELALRQDIKITAVRWVQRAKRDWSSYIATRAEDLNHKGTPQRWNR